MAGLRGIRLASPPLKAAALIGGAAAAAGAVGGIPLDAAGDTPATPAAAASSPSPASCSSRGCFDGAAALAGLSGIPPEASWFAQRRSGPGSASTLRSEDWADAAASSSSAPQSRRAAAQEPPLAATPSSSASQPRRAAAQEPSAATPSSSGSSAPQPRRAAAQEPPSAAPHSPSSPTLEPTQHMRTAAKAWVSFGGRPTLPAGFPEGPYPTLAFHIDRLRQYASDPAHGGGIFQVRLKDKRDLVRVGPQARLVCKRQGFAPGTPTERQAGQRNRGSVRCGCKWSVMIEVVSFPATSPGESAVSG